MYDEILDGAGRAGSKIRARSRHHAGNCSAHTARARKRFQKLNSARVRLIPRFVQQPSPGEEGEASQGDFSLNTSVHRGVVWSLSRTECNR